MSFFGCHKKETVTVDNETQSAVDNSLADQEYSELPGTANDHAINTKGTGATRDARMIAAPCNSLTLISGDTLFGLPGHVHPTYTLDISNTNCGTTMPDGRTRTGQLKITLTGRIRKPGSQMIIKMIGYNVTLPMGTSTANVSYSCDSMVVTTLDSSIYTKFNVKLINGVCLWGSGKIIKYSSDRVVTNYPKGNPINTDPVTEVYGTSNGVNRDARAFSVVIPQSTPLVKHKSCKYIDKGIFDLTPDGFKTRTVDFGNGTCDNNATFTVNGNTVAFTLN